MLQKLTIENFALFESATCDFSVGLNVISGETGAGKTILMEALNAALGGKVSSDFIRTDAKCFYIEAQFAAVSAGTILQLKANDIAVDADRVLVTRRYTMGKSEQSVNGVRVTLATLKLLAQDLIDLHGQHEHQALLREQTHLAIIDCYDSRITGVYEKYLKEYTLYRKTVKQLNDYEQLGKNAAQRSDILAWQIQEISEAALTPGEEEQLEDSGKILANAEKIALAATHCYSMLRGGKDSGVIDKLYLAKQDIEMLARYYPPIAEQVGAVNSAALAMEDVSETVRDIGNSVEFNQQKLNTCYSRLEQIKKLKRKYGASVDEILAFRLAAERELDEIENLDVQIQQCKNDIAKVLQCLSKSAEELSALRLEAARMFSKTLTAELSELAMSGGRLQVEITQQSEFTETGRDSVEIMFSANIGEPVKPLSKVASGGELSRIALAIKSQMNINSDANTVVFDEIDSGVGGKTALVVAEKLKKIAQTRQVLCITHLAQIASIADKQFLLIKMVENNRTASNIVELTAIDRKTEIARMLSGIVNDKSIAMAEELLKKPEEE
ncbi:MAG: DNA repair protein RecN [Negativicutes bacterium]|jgi:DNA repair protein RecN (Recombination protein N)